MGRGDTRDQRAASHGLLFGPRRAKPLDKERQQQTKKIQRQRLSEARKNGHTEALHAAEAELLQGNAAPLLDLLSHPAPRGTVEIERRELRAMSGRLRAYYHGSSAPIVNLNLGVLEAFQQLRQRAAARRLPKTQQRILRSTLLSAAHRLAIADTGERIERHRQEIGSLPRVWTIGRSLLTHLRDPDGGDTLCGQPHSNITPVNAITNVGEATPLSYPLGCEKCRKCYLEGTPAASYEPDEWLEKWTQHQDHLARNFEYQLTRVFGWRGPTPEENVTEIRRQMSTHRLAQVKASLDGCSITTPDAVWTP